MQKYMTKIRDWIATTMVVTGLRIGGNTSAQFMILVLVTRLMRAKDIAAIELVEDGVVVHKHPEGGESQAVTLH